MLWHLAKRLRETDYVWSGRLLLCLIRMLIPTLGCSQLLEKSKSFHSIVIYAWVFHFPGGGWCHHHHHRSHHLHYHSVSLLASIVFSSQKSFGAKEIPSAVALNIISVFKLVLGVRLQVWKGWQRSDSENTSSVSLASTEDTFIFFVFLTYRKVSSGVPP